MNFQQVLNGDIQQVIRSKSELPDSLFSQIITIFVEGIHSVFLVSSALLVLAFVAALFVGKGKLPYRQHREKQTMH